MPFKPDRGEKATELDKLRIILNQTKLSTENNPLYQFCNSLLRVVDKNVVDINKDLQDLKTVVITGPGGGGGSEISTHYDCPLTDGNETEADLIFADGECIIVQVPNP